jgi:hypothetical protein
VGRSTEVVGGAPGALVVKRATGDDISRLVAEAQRLEAAAHPGVVELLGSAATSDGWELRLAHGGRPLELAGAPPVRTVAGLAAGIAATLADLHDAGIVHGRIDASHVLIGAHGRPVLCGLGGDPVSATPADDVAALGTLLTTLLEAGNDAETVPDRRWTRRRSLAASERRSLLVLADQACADPPSRRPTARRLAAAIAESVPDTPATSRRTSAAPVARHAAPARPRFRALAGALVAVVVVGAVGLRASGHDSRSVTSATERSPGTVVPTTASAPRTTSDPPTTTTSTSVVPVRVDGTTLVVAGRRYQVGQSGDHVLVGDWDCVSGATPALLRPSTGEVFIFTTWPADEAVTVHATTKVPGAATLHLEEGAGGCPRLEVRRIDGTAVPVPTGGAT